MDYDVQSAASGVATSAINDLGDVANLNKTEARAALLHFFGHDNCVTRAEAEAARLRDLVEEFLESHPSGEHYWHADPEGLPSGWCKECLSEWPCLIERARTALHGEDDDDDG